MKKSRTFLLGSLILFLCISVGFFISLQIDPTKPVNRGENSGIAYDEQKTYQHSVVAAQPKEENKPASSETSDFIETNKNDTANEENNEKLLEERYQALNKNESYPSIDSRMQEIKARRQGQALSTEQLLDAMEKQEVWDSIDEPEKRPKFAENLKFQKPKFISFHRAKLESLVMGDEIALPLEDDRQTYEMTIDEIKNHADGNITWRGYIELDGNRHYASFTQNNSGLTVGGFTTPNGHFTVEAQGDIGWVAESQSAFHNAGDGPDYIIP